MLRFCWLICSLLLLVNQIASEFKIGFEASKNFTITGMGYQLFGDTIEIVDLEYEKLNETTTKFSGKVILHEELGDGMINLNFHYKSDNVTVWTTSSSDLCTAISKPRTWFLYPSLVEHAGLPSSCPISPRSFILNDFLFDTTKFMANTIKGEYKVNYGLQSGNRHLANIYFHYKLD